MQEEISSLIAKYGIRDVHSFLLNHMECEYKYLKKIFEIERVEKVEQNKKIISTNPNNIIKKKYDNPVLIEKTNEIVEVESEESEELEETEIKEVKNEGSWKDPKEMKAWQKEQEIKKLLENKSKGIKKTDLLTKENLTKWLLEEGRTFSYISREYIGCKDTEVSAAAKLWGIKKPKKN